MATRKLSDGVGKKIVEALKKQSEIEIIPISDDVIHEDDELITEDTEDQDVFEETEEEEEDFLSNLPSDDDLEKLSDNEGSLFTNAEPTGFMEEPAMQSAKQTFATQNYTPSDNFIKELDSFEIPSNIAVLKKLITQLPSGVSRHTGAQIIKQTMEALGISMKSVLQEAQQVQEGLSTSAKECHATIQEYKKQIAALEKQSQSNQRQYAALNELISLFIQTGV